MWIQLVWYAQMVVLLLAYSLAANARWQDTHDLFNYGVGYHGYILIYSINSRPSFDALTKINDKLLTEVGRGWLPRVLVGNKADMEGLREVSSDEGRALASKWRCSFLEVSAKHNHRIPDIFNALLIEMDKNVDGHSDEKKKGGCIIT